MDVVEMEMTVLPLNTIRVGTRKRPVDEKVVREIAKSIEQQGLFQPIGVKAPSLPDKELREGFWDLVFGAHRLAAYALLQQESIEARILPTGLTDDEYNLIELQENSVRNDLTKAQRQTYTGDIAKLLAKITTEQGLANGQKNWFADLAKKTGNPYKTLQNWWTAFCQETHCTTSPGKALAPEREAFFDWLHEQQQREEEEKARQEEEAAAARRAEDIADALENLKTLAADYGREAVIAEVINVFLAEESSWTS